MQSTQEYANGQLTSDDIARLEFSIGEDRFQILKAIYETPNIQHKELSQKLNKSPSNLSNLIYKINYLEFTLIQTINDGRAKFYSLTAAGRQYVEHELSTSRNYSGNGAYGSSKSAETMIQEAVRVIEFFKEKCGSNWRSILNSFLNGEQYETPTSEIKEAFDKLSGILCDYRRRDADLLEQIFSALEDELLTDALTKYLDQKFIYFDLLKPLLTSYKSDYIAQFKIIDAVFSELHPLIFTPSEDKGAISLQLSNAEHDNLLLGIAKLSYAFIDKGYSKNDAVAHWKKSFLTEELAFYIAEKCSHLKFLQKLISNF